MEESSPSVVGDSGDEQELFRELSPEYVTRPPPQVPEEDVVVLASDEEDSNTVAVIGINTLRRRRARSRSLAEELPRAVESPSTSLRLSSLAASLRIRSQVLELEDSSSNESNQNRGDNVGEAGEDEVEFIREAPPSRSRLGSRAESQVLGPVINIDDDEGEEAGGAQVENEPEVNRARQRDENEERGNEEENQEEDAEESEPPQKIPRLDIANTSTIDDDDGFICQICYEPFANSGGHRVCCLKCGHIYGKDCIERWIQSSKRCPSCNCKALKKDVRVLYVKNLKAMDRSELDKLKQENDLIKIEKNKIELSNSQLRCKEEIRSKECARLQNENQRLLLENHALRRLVKSPPELIDLSVGNPVPGSSRSFQISGDSTNSTLSGFRVPKLNLTKHFDIKEGQSRVGAYSEWMNLFVVSHAITNRLFPAGSFGIKKINCLEMKAFQSFPIHQKTLRDMAFCPLQSDLLLTVGLDKKAVLFNCNSNCAVQTFNTTNQLWSCCWNSVSQNIFYVGGANGSITSYDIRAPREALGTLDMPSTENGGVARLKFVPPAYQNQTFNMSGLLIQKMHSLWFAEMTGGTQTNEPRFHQLPLEGPFVNVDFEENSRHVLVSSRPKMSGVIRSGAGHAVCVLGKTYSTAEERDIFSCDVVQNFNGGFEESMHLLRSSLFSPEQGQVYLAANGENKRSVRVWDIASSQQNSLVRINEDAAWDFVPGKINDNSFLAVVSQSSLNFFNVK